MDRVFLYMALMILCIIVGALIIEFMLIQYAGAEHDKDSYGVNGAVNRVVYLLEHILEEEKKQTALLDHIDCITSGIVTVGEAWNYGDIKPYRIDCNDGLPLNVTGVWTP